jgi:hypothetical protein
MAPARDANAKVEDLVHTHGQRDAHIPLQKLQNLHIFLMRSVHRGCACTKYILIREGCPVMELMEAAYSGACPMGLRCCLRLLLRNIDHGDDGLTSAPIGFGAS